MENSNQEQKPSFSETPKDKQNNSPFEIPVNKSEGNLPESHPTPEGAIPPKDLKDLHSKIYATPPEPPKPESFHPLETGQESAEIPEPQVHLKREEPKLKAWVFVFASFLVLLLVVGSISLYKEDLYWIRDILGFGLPKDPVKAVEKVSQNMAKVKSYKNDLSANLSVEVDNQKIGGVLEGSGEMDNSSEEAKLNLKLKDLSLPKELDVPELKSLNLEANLITTKKEVYFKTPLLEDKWHKIDLNTFLNPAILSKSEKEFKDEDFGKMAGAVLYSEGIEKSGAGELGKYVKSAKKLKDEKIKGEGTYHYLLELDLIKMLETEEDFKSLPEFQKETLKTFFSKYLTLKTDFWVSKRDLLLKKQSGDFDLKFNMADFGGSGIFKIKVNYQEELKDINKPVSIEKPKDAVEFDENMLINLMMGGITSTPEGTESLKLARIKARDSQRKADLRQIQTALEQYADDNNGKYPALTDDSKDGSFLKDLSPDYLKKVPLDPSHPTYYYKYESDGQKYKLTCVLENADDPDGKKVGSYNIYTVAGP